MFLCRVAAKLPARLTISSSRSTARGLADFRARKKCSRLCPIVGCLNRLKYWKTQALEYPVLLEWLRPRGTVYIFGAGHVGVCVAHLASYVNFRVVVMDDRADFATAERIPDAEHLVALKSFDEAFPDLRCRRGQLHSYCDPRSQS